MLTAEVQKGPVAVLSQWVHSDKSGCAMKPIDYAGAKIEIQATSIYMILFNDRTYVMIFAISICLVQDDSFKEGHWKYRACTDPEVILVICHGSPFYKIICFQS